MRVKLPYKVKAYAELPGARAVVSPYDMESLVVEGVAAQPRATVASVPSEGWVLEPPCAGAVYLSRDAYVCGAVAGLSSTDGGLALLRDVRGFRLVGRGFELTGEVAAYASVPGALAVALHDGRELHVAVATYGEVRAFEGVARERPASVHLGYRLASVVLGSGRSVVVYENRVVDVGYPARAVAYVQGTPLVESSGWLVYADREDPRPAVKASAAFAGFARNLPALREGSRLYVLDQGALVEYAEVRGEATAWGWVVDDLGLALRVLDPRGREALRTAKDPEARCWATPYGVLCCRGARCGVVEPGESEVVLTPGFGEVHRVLAEVDHPVRLRYGDSVVRCADSCTVEDPGASVLRPHAFAVEVEHLLGTAEAVVVSRPPPVVVEGVEAELLTSQGVHECGGLGLLRLRAGNISKPGRAVVKALGTVLEPGRVVEVCAGTIPRALDVVAEDPVAGDSLVLASVAPRVVELPRPRVGLRVEHLDGSSRLRLEVEEGAEVLEATLCCGRRCGELVELVESCRAPARVYARVRRGGFIYSYSLPVHLPKLVDCLEASFGGRAVCREGGFVATYATPEPPAVPPLGGFRVAVLLDSMELRFRSRGIGRAVVVAPELGRARALQLKPGRAAVRLPIASRYVILAEAGARWRYEVSVPLELLLRAASRHAEALREALLRVGAKP